MAYLDGAGVACPGLYFEAGLLIKVRIKSSGKVQEMVPAVARALLAAGFAETAPDYERPEVETATFLPAHAAVMPYAAKLHIEV